MGADSAERLAGRRIALTGGTGFIGTHLLTELISAGANAELLGPTPFRRAEIGRLIDAAALRYWPRALAGDDASLHEVLRGCDSLVHLAYHFPRATAFWARFAEEVRCNLLPTVRLLEAAEKTDLDFVCFASSVTVYGRAQKGVREDGPLHVATPYSAVKLIQEACVRQWTRRTGRRAAILRLATVYGPGETVSRAVPNFIRAVLAGRSPVVDGHGQQLFDLIFVTDVAEAFVAALERRPKSTFNIGSGRGRTPREVATLVTRLCGATMPIVGNGTARDHGAPICDVSRAATRLGFRPRTSLEAGLREEIQWLRALLAPTPTALPVPSARRREPPATDRKYVASRICD